MQDHIFHSHHESPANVDSNLWLTRYRATGVASFETFSQRIMSMYDRAIIPLLDLSEFFTRLHELPLLALASLQVP